MKILGRRAAIEEIVERKKLDLQFAEAKAMEGDLGIRYLIGEQIPKATIVDGTGIAAEKYDEVLSALKARSRQRERGSRACSTRWPTRPSWRRPSISSPATCRTRISRTSRVSTRALSRTPGRRWPRNRGEATQGRGGGRREEGRGRGAGAGCHPARRDARPHRIHPRDHGVFRRRG